MIFSRKTPQFNKAIAAYYEKIVPDRDGGQWIECKFSGENFHARAQDVAFYRDMKVPLPTICPRERRRIRLASQNNYYLFKGYSAFSGELVASMFSPNTLFNVFEHRVWYSDLWSAMDFSRGHNPSRSFFDQFHELQIEVPHPNLIVDRSNINSDYTNVSRRLKNCYLVFDQDGGEGLYYHQCCENDESCFDCFGLRHSSVCYECSLGNRLERCFFCEMCAKCKGSYFLWDCVNSRHCFMSSGLRNKQYYFRNQFLGKREYERKMKDIYLGDFDRLEELRKEFSEMKKRAARRPLQIGASTNVACSDFVSRSENVYYSLLVTASSDIAYSDGVNRSHNCYDLLGGTEDERCYEMAQIRTGRNKQCKFSMHLDRCENVEYSSFCRDSSNCFGCIGLVGKEYCFLNIQYTRREYWKKIDEVKTKMLSDGEYGEFFPPAHLPFPYRISLAASYPGFRDFEAAGRYGYDTSPVEEAGEKIEASGMFSDQLPKDIKKVGKGLLWNVIYDKANNKHFRFHKREVDFYREYNLALPREDPTVRMQKRREMINLDLRFYTRTCLECGRSFDTRHDPAAEEIVYCESCYQRKVYK